MLTLDQAHKIIAASFAEGAKLNLAPLCVAVMDSGGNLLALSRDEKASIYRPQIAMGKASACIGLGVGGVKTQAIGKERPDFSNSLGAVFPNGFVPAQGGVLIRDAHGIILGAVGVTGDVSAQDELAAIAGIQAVGLVADTGA